MPVEPIPAPLEHLAGRPFSFYPPILNIEHNEWMFRQATWSELQVENSKTGLILWIPRAYLGEVPQVDQPVMIVGLARELEYEAGTVVPHSRRILTMPRAAAAPPASASEPHAPHKGLRLESRAESRVGLLILGVLAAGILLTFVVVSFFRGGSSGGQVTYKPILQSELGLSGNDDYWAVLRKLGTPAADRWKSETGELQYRLLDYPGRSFSIILMGADRDHLRYIGALDRNWKPVDSVTLPTGVNTSAMLRTLKKF